MAKNILSVRIRSIRVQKINSVPLCLFLKSISYKYACLALISTLLVTYMSSIPGSYLGVGSATEQILSNFAHIPAFAFLTLLWLKTFNANGDRLFSNLFVLSGLLLFAIVTEFLQSFVTGRTASFMDFGLNLIGIILGFLILRLSSKSSLKILGHGLTQINTDQKNNLFSLRRRKIHSKQAPSYIWTWFRRQGTCAPLAH